MQTQNVIGWSLAAILSHSAIAADVEFVGVPGANWVTPSNWENGSYPSADDIALLDSTASVDTPAPNNVRGIGIGTRGEGTLHVTFSADLAATATGVSSKVGSGTGNVGKVEQTNGSLSFNALEIGSDSATGTYNLQRGTLTVARQVSNNSLYLGTDPGQSSSGLGTITIANGSLTTRGGAVLGSSNGGIGVFEVDGSYSAQIGIGSANNLDGSWIQNSGSIIRAKIDRTAQGVTPILIDDAEDDGVGGDVVFENGALLDVGFTANFVNGGTFTVMEWEGDVTDNGLQFAPSVNTDIWSFDVDTATKRLTVTAAGGPFVREFVHPGSRHKRSDLERMRDMVAAGIEPWASSFADFASRRNARFTYTVNSANDPLTFLSDAAYNNFRNDCVASYNNAVIWAITGDSRHAEKSIEIFNTWSGLTGVDDSIIPLDLGRSILHMIEGAEIIRHTYTGWDQGDIQAFSDMLVYPGYSNTSVPNGDTTFYWGMYNGDPARAGNQGFFAMRALLAMGVFLDNERIYDRVIRLTTGATNRADDLPYPTGPPVNSDPVAVHEWAIQSNQNSRRDTIPDYGYNEVIANYIWESGQNAESSRDQVHAAVGLINITTLCETAWSQGDDLYGHLDNLPLFGWEYTLRYNLTLGNAFDGQSQPTPFEPTLENGGYLQRLDRPGRRFALKINPGIDGNQDGMTRGEANTEPVYEINLGHYRDRMGISGDEIKWLEEGHTLLEQTQGFEKEGNNVYSMPNWGGLKYRRVSPGDPIRGFINSAPDFSMNLIPATVEAENYDYFPIDGEGHTYHDISDGNSGLSYRPTEGVGISPASEGSFAISSIEEGEWVTYTVSAPETRTHDIAVRYASTAPGGAIQFSFDGTDVSGQVTVPHGGTASTGASDWQDLIIATDVPLSQGVQQLRINFGGASDSFLLNSFSIQTPAIEDWRVTHFGTAQNAGIAADTFDADMDGLSNLLEYAIGQDPRAASGNPALIVSDSTDNPGDLEIIFDRISDPSLTYEIQRSENLSDSSWVPVVTITGQEDDTIVIPESPSPDAPRMFFRLQVTR